MKTQTCKQEYGLAVWLRVPLSPLMGTPEPLPETGILANQRPRKCDMTFVLTPRYRVQDGSWPNHKNSISCFVLMPQWIKKSKDDSDYIND